MALAKRGGMTSFAASRRAPRSAVRRSARGAILSVFATVGVTAACNGSTTVETPQGIGGTPVVSATSSGAGHPVVTGPDATGGNAGRGSSQSRSSARQTGGSAAGGGNTGAGNASGGTSGASGAAGSNGSITGTGGGGNVTGALSAGCPTTPPQVGAACSGALECEYGDDWNPYCNTALSCAQGTWGANSLGAVCPAPLPSLPTNASDCAASAETVPVGQACSTSSTCSYDGAICWCGAPCYSAGWGEVPDCDPDAGATTGCCDTTKPTWSCATGAPYCPVPRPRVGSECASDAGTCAITAPSTCGQTVLNCGGGVWFVDSTGCFL
jgi:hypothetical protein